jgi:hypothetical protein
MKKALADISNIVYVTRPDMLVKLERLRWEMGKTFWYSRTHSFNDSSASSKQYASSQQKERLMDVMMELYSSRYQTQVIHGEARNVLISTLPDLKIFTYKEISLNSEKKMHGNGSAKLEDIQDHTVAGYSITLNDDLIGHDFWIMSNFEGTIDVEATAATEIAQSECNSLRAAYCSITGYSLGNPVIFPSEALFKKMVKGYQRLPRWIKIGSTSDMENPAALITLSASKNSNPDLKRCLHTHIFGNRRSSFGMNSNDGHELPPN